jgi:hypothetical protein
MSPTGLRVIDDARDGDRDPTGSVSAIGLAGDSMRILESLVALFALVTAVLIGLGH